MNHYMMIRRLRGPAILLLIGGVWLLHSTGVIDHPCRWFVPLLLILLGVLMLAERMVLTTGGGYPQGPYPGQPGAAQPPAGPATEGYHPPYAEQYQAPFPPPPPPPPGYFDPAAPPPPICWRRKEPIGAIVLIALGLMFLLGQLDVFHGRFFEFAWPVLLIALGIWLFVRRMGDSQGGSK